MSYKKIEHICSSCSTQFVVITKEEDFHLIESCPICQTPIFDESIEEESEEEVEE